MTVATPFEVRATLPILEQTAKVLDLMRKQNGKDRRQRVKKDPD